MKNAPERLAPSCRRPVAEAGAFAGPTRTHEHSSPAATWSFTFGLPTPLLAPVVRNFWEVRGDFDFGRDRMLPSGDIALVVNLGAPQRVFASGAESSEHRGTWIVGPQLSPLTVVVPPVTWICGARLTYRGAFQALGVSPRSLAGLIVDLDAVRGRVSADLTDRLREADSPAQRFERLGRTIAEWTLPAPGWSIEVGHALRLLRATRGSLPVEVLAREVGWSRQKLHRLFLDFVGIPPKTMSRLERFHHAVDLIGFDAEVDLADVANGAGYFDQAHFSHEFVKFSGLTPGVFLRSRIPDVRQGFAAPPSAPTSSPSPA